MVRDGRYPSVSSFVTEAIREHLAGADAHGMLVAVLRQIGGEPTDADRAWVDDAHVVMLARRHGLPVITTDPDDLRALDPKAAVVEL